MNGPLNGPLNEPATERIGHVAVCALTYLRPAGLGELLAGLAALTIPDGVVVDVVIVDNDPEGSGTRTVEDRRNQVEAAGFGLHYVHEPRRGISHARNRAVATGLALGADAVCFIDDDEVPDPEWLVEFIATQRATGADIVTGPVFPVFERQPPQWMLDGGFFERRRHAHHERIPYATTSTVLVMRRCFAGRDEPFDPAFGLSGGEDTHLFAQLREAGFVAVWCDRAHVHETIPASRIDARWLRTREFRRGQTLSLSLRARGMTPWKALRRVANGGQHIARGALRWLIGLVRGGRAARFRGAQQVVFGCGMWSGLLGRRYQEYTTTHGS